MATSFNRRVAALEAAAADAKQDGCHGFDFGPPLTFDEWCKEAKTQQAELTRGTHEQNA